MLAGRIHQFSVDQRPPVVGHSRGRQYGGPTVPPGSPRHRSVVPVDLVGPRKASWSRTFIWTSRRVPVVGAHRPNGRRQAPLVVDSVGVDRDVGQQMPLPARPRAVEPGGLTSAARTERAGVVERVGDVQLREQRTGRGDRVDPGRELGVEHAGEALAPVGRNPPEAPTSPLFTRAPALSDSSTVPSSWTTSPRMS